MWKKIVIISIILIILFVSFWTFSIVRCEVITTYHGSEFMEIDEINTASKFKILKYNNSFARIYCVNFNKSNGSIYNFIKKDGIWVYNEWEKGVWSKSGSADGFIWPYIR